MDWLDIDSSIAERVDFVATSFVKSTKGNKGLIILRVTLLHDLVTGLAGYFGIAERVDFIATSSVKSAEVIDRLKS
ncbi:hypothetical protein C5167_011629 [Papaver somniferum]|uniref:Uncharacterized protein n=1 Tax=Papaver somniferum TaxID=3469 RepID=A0A4Y7K7N7_PAPSO|nr:hypothetical protein C5167_011629 [Papaver somniferum]